MHREWVVHEAKTQSENTLGQAQLIKSTIKIHIYLQNFPCMERDLYSCSPLLLAIVESSLLSSQLFDTASWYADCQTNFLVTLRLLNDLALSMWYCYNTQIHNMLRVKFKNYVYLAIFEVNWSSKRIREGKEVRKELGTEMYNNLIAWFSFSTTIIIYTPSATSITPPTVHNNLTVTN